MNEVVPIQTAKLSGAWEKSAIPPNAYLNNLWVVQSVSPATRSTLWYSRYLVLKPTQAKILRDADKDVGLAIVMAKTGLAKERAELLLKEHENNVSSVLKENNWF